MQCLAQALVVFFLTNIEITCGFNEVVFHLLLGWPIPKDVDAHKVRDKLEKPETPCRFYQAKPASMQSQETGNEVAKDACRLQY